MYKPFFTPFSEERKVKVEIGYLFEHQEQLHPPLKEQVEKKKPNSSSPIRTLIPLSKRQQPTSPTTTARGASSTIQSPKRHSPRRSRTSQSTNPGTHGRSSSGSSGSRRPGHFVLVHLSQLLPLLLRSFWSVLSDFSPFEVRGSCFLFGFGWDCRED